LDLVRSIFAAWERGDFSSVAWADPDIEYVFADGPSPGRWTGQAGMAEGFRDWVSAWEELRVEADRYRALDGERVFVLTHVNARGKTSGLEVSQFTATEGGANLFHIRDGKVTRLVSYFDRDHALTDLALAPQDDEL
jgi:ketosteroid isomerase-like protein